VTKNRKSNELIHEKSPYLLQHAHNPVNWYPWGEEAFAKAKGEDKPVFLSIGYSTCHWCHVMERESFEDEEVAALLNRDYVCIKVDREERPDIDAVYMQVCQAMTGSGGWPLTLFLTPEQKPFFAATYLPKQTRCGVPGMVSMLPEIARRWKSNRSELMSAGEEVLEFMYSRQTDGDKIGAPDKELLFSALRQFREDFDSANGGFGGAPKFPMAHNLLFLLRLAALEKDEWAVKMVGMTLEQMYRGGIFDHVGGGFCRYSTDEIWLVPHFEKMLYDNAMLAYAYLEAYQKTGRPFYEVVARRTLDYVLHEMTDKNGGFYSAQDADSEGVEGKYYVFTKQEVFDVLGKEEGEAFCAYYGITEKGNFEGKNIPNLLGNPGFEDDDPRTKHAREKLYDYRLRRTSLHKDDKILTAWNALMMAALAKAAQVLEDDRYWEAAKDAQSMIEKRLMSPDGRLWARWRDNEAAIMGKLDDYAFYAWALLELYAARYDEEDLRLAILTAEGILRDFADEKHGGYFLTSKDDEKLIQRPKDVYDGALPSGNSVTALVLGRLARLTADVKWQKAYDEQIEFVSLHARRYAPGYGFALLAVIEALYPSKELVCVTSKEGVPAELNKLLQETDIPNLTVLVKSPQNKEALSEIVPIVATYPIPDVGNAYYLCASGSCRPPVSDVSQLRGML